MRLAFWKSKPVEQAPSGECRHLWSNWSEPGACRVTVYGMFEDPTERAGWAQDRHCLHCNMYERRCA